MSSLYGNGKSLHVRDVTNAEFIETICQGLTNVHELWAVPVELGMALWLLEKQLGLAFLAPTAVAMFAVCLFPPFKIEASFSAFSSCTTNFVALQTGGIAIMSKYMGSAQKVWIEGIQTRVDVTASMLSSMKVKQTQVISPRFYTNHSIVGQDARFCQHPNKYHTRAACHGTQALVSLSQTPLCSRVFGYCSPHFPFPFPLTHPTSQY